MSSGTIELVPVEDLERLLEGRPPLCEAVSTLTHTPCDRPAVVRIRCRCVCGNSKPMFLCDRCLAWLRVGRARCGDCWNTDFHWSEC